ncbi:uncharacterized protein A1O5_06578 [Cladophialophora psammophila CBS 110553]|uniref:Pre-mRNA-splicing factor SYF2 n=1 Tax=Cladophialophora psammophila CBS 110553 TaxID=1182543 RepID=W9XJG9_9EURO|nr:uncharacterized protein A1O5_06578 [Cladophialophora psammophila CBS 110553]EXJ70509.1 hypothetical protein A1O5_06578 [Cladophialophora psammophila CBS 110553]
MPPSKRRKLSPEPVEPQDDADDTRESSQVTEKLDTDGARAATPPVGNQTDNDREESTSQPNEAAVDAPSNATTIPSTTNADRLARFAALKSRATQSAKSNLAEAKAEANRAAMDPALLANLNRRSAIAQHNLLKADTEEEEGKGAFERKRAWDYTIEESERWDEKQERKKTARENNAFSDWSDEAARMYDRQIRELEKNSLKDGHRSREEYERQKAEILENAARTGGLEIVEMENGDLVAIDKDGRFYADHDSLGFVEQKPKRENVDRLVDDLRKAEEARFKKRRERGRDVDEGDVTYINDKNKQFNLKLARFYDRYTRDIRESFERGTAM